MKQLWSNSHFNVWASERQTSDFKIQFDFLAFSWSQQKLDYVFDEFAISDSIENVNETV